MAIGKLPDSDTGEDEDIFAEINITPLTDVFLVMLIIFMVAAAAAVQQKKKEVEEVQEMAASEERSGLKINLPSGASQEIDPVAQSIVVALLPSGEIFINETAVTEAELETIFRQAFVSDQNTQVVLQADAGVNHGRVVAVMEKAKRVGLTKLAIATSGG